MERKKEGGAVGLRWRSRHAVMVLGEVRVVQAASEKSHPEGYQSCLVLFGHSVGEKSRKQPMPGCVAAKACCLAILQLLNHHSRKATGIGKAGPKQVLLRAVWLLPPAKWLNNCLLYLPYS